LHRVGRTARGADAKGKSILILVDNELSLIKHLENENVFDLFNSSF
jgi:superfamily II DNA/RNA helicase